MRHLAAVFTLLSVFPAVAHAQMLSRSLQSEPLTNLAIAARERGNAVRGAILFPQQKLACASCHAAGRQDLLGPDLSRLGKDVSDEQLVESLLLPSKTIRKGFESVSVQTTDGRVLAGRVLDRNAQRLVLRQTSPGYRRLTLATSDIAEVKVSPTSAMPDNLVDQLKDRQQFLDLVRYLIELRDAGLSTNDPMESGANIGIVRAAIDERLLGRALIANLGCVSCHSAEGATLPSKRAPNLGVTMQSIDPHYVERYLRDPSHVKPGTMMPNVLSAMAVEERQQAAKELTHYLISRTKRAFTRQTLDSEAATRGETVFHTVGCVACHSPRNASGEELLAKVSVPLGAIDQKYNLEGLVALLKDPLTGRPSGRMPSLNLTHWEAQDVANYLLREPSSSRTNAKQPPRKQATQWRTDEELAAKGKERFASLGCAACHEPEEAPNRNLPSLDKLRQDRGCLSNTAGNWPVYDLTAKQRSAIGVGLESLQDKLTPREQVHLSLAAFRCTSCHERDGIGGVSDDRDDYFLTANPNLGPQGRIPPTLTNVGAKLKPKWLRQVLVSGKAIRPYLKTRMPQYGAANVAHFVESLPALDELPEIEFAKLQNEKEIRKTGHELVGSSGLNCIACHTFQQKAGATMAAVDLTEMEERLEKRWFYHYMEAPQRLSRNTVMPTFWPGGRAIRKDILEGDSKEQIEAIWQYLRDGRQARTPRGLVSRPIELLAKTDEAVMLRRSYPGIGKRGIGVGYPREVNIAYDAEQMRVGLMWKGKFADPGGVWRSQGHGQVRPLSRKVVRFAAGPDLDDARTPWKVNEERPPHHRFRGYYLDKQQRPIFMYRFNDIEVEEAIVDLPADQGGAILRRTITLEGKSERQLRFRVATGRQIRRVDGAYQIDQALQVRLKDGDASMAVAQSEDQSHLNAVFKLRPGVTKFVIDYAWLEDLK